MERWWSLTRDAQVSSKNMGAKTRDEWTKVGGRSFRPDSLERQSRFLWQGQVTVPVYCQRLWRKSIAFTQDVFKEHSCLLGWLWLQERSLSTLFLFFFFFLQWLCSQNSLLEGLWLMQGPTGRFGPRDVSSSPHARAQTSWPVKVSPPWSSLSRSPKIIEERPCQL